MGTTKRFRFSLRGLLVIVLAACCWSAWVANRNMRLKRHQALVYEVIRRGGTVEYQSGKYGGNLAGLFPERDWLDTLFPPRQQDRIVTVTFQRARGRVGTSLPGKTGIHRIDPNWSLESMLDQQEPMESFPEMRRLEFSKTPLPRHGLQCIERLTQLEQLAQTETRWAEHNAGSRRALAREDAQLRDPAV